MARIKRIMNIIARLKRDLGLKIRCECTRPGEGDLVFSVALTGHDGAYKIVGSDSMVGFLKGLEVGYKFGVKELKP